MTTTKILDDMFLQHITDTGDDEDNPGQEIGNNLDNHRNYYL